MFRYDLTLTVGAALGGVVKYVYNVNAATLFMVAYCVGVIVAAGIYTIYKDCKEN